MTMAVKNVVYLDKLDAAHDQQIEDEAAYERAINAECERIAGDPELVRDIVADLADEAWLKICGTLGRLANSVGTGSGLGAEEALDAYMTGTVIASAIVYTAQQNLAKRQSNKSLN